MKFGDMTISQIKEICDKTKDCSACPLLLHIDPKVNPIFGPTVCVFNTHPRDWAAENPVNELKQKAEDKLTNREWLARLTDEQLAKFLTLGLTCRVHGGQFEYEIPMTIQAVARQFNHSVYGLQDWFSKPQQYEERE